MARPLKQGLDYFPLDVGFLKDIKIRKIMRVEKDTITVLIALLCNIYSDNGYYMEFGEDECFIISEDAGVSEDIVNIIVTKAVEVNFFDKSIFDKYKILTSKGIQNRFFNAVTRRKQVFYDFNLILINVNDYNNLVNVDNNYQNVNNNEQVDEVNVGRSTQSKVKKSKVKESKESSIEDLIKNYSENESIKTTLNDFVEMRRVIKQPLTTRAMTALLNKLDSLSTNDNEKIKILENSIMNNWRGIFQLKEEDKEKINKWEGLDLGYRF